MEPTSSFKVRITKNYSDSDGEKYSEWVHSVNATLGLLRRRPRDSSTYRVPTKLRATQPAPYTPQVVCIGPFHLNKPELRATEELKWRYMLAYLDRVVGTDTENMQINELGGVYDENSAQTLALNKCCKVVSELEEEARAWYAEDINLDKHQLVEMLLVDACFILELFYRYNVTTIKKFQEQHSPSIHEDQVPFESLPNNYTMMNTLTYDLLRLENQIPYIILQQLFDVIPSSKRISNGTQGLSLRQHVLRFFHRIPMLSINVLELDSYINDATFSHLLDVLWQVCNLTSWELPLQLTYGKWGFKRGASELTKAGFQIICRNRSDSMSIVDIGFHEGMISIPSVVIDKTTVTLLRNLIALEQTRSGGQVITSYVILMSTLIGSEEDATLLERLGILQNPSKYYTDLSGFFKSFCNEIYSERFYFKDLCDEVENYQIPLWSWYGMKGYMSFTWSRWNKSLKDLKRDYFQNRWSFIAFLTGSFVILLTLLQTLYTIRDFYPPYH